MATNAGEIAGFPVRAARRDLVTLRALVTIGASGAVSATDSDDPAFTVTKNASAGTYDLAYPKCLKAWIDVSVVSAAGTVVGGYTTAKAATSGTAQIVTSAGDGTATNPASGNIVEITIVCSTRE